MSQFDRRIWVTAIVAVICFGGTWCVRQGYTFDVVPPPRDVKTMPLTLDGWVGEDIPMDEQVKKVLNAQETVNRIYRGQTGEAVTVSVSVWLSPDSVSEVAPHVPKLCYTNAGWTTLAERNEVLELPNGKFTFATLLFEKAEDKIVVAYWYELGEHRFTTAAEARRIHRQLWGRKKWPASVKVLLQTNAANLDAGMPVIRRFAAIVEEQINGTSAISPATK